MVIHPYAEIFGMPFSENKDICQTQIYDENINVDIEVKSHRTMVIHSSYKQNMTMSKDNIPEA